MHDLLDLYPDILAERRELPRTRPVKFRFIAPEHGHYGPRLSVPTRRERIAAWWHEHRWELAVNALLTAACLAAFYALGLAIGVGLALADRVVS